MSNQLELDIPASGSKSRLTGAVAVAGGVVMLALAAVASVSFNDPVAMMPATAAGPAALAQAGQPQASTQNLYDQPPISPSAQTWNASSYGESIGAISTEPQSP